MADTCIPYTVAGLTLNEDGEDTLIVEEIDGLDGIPLRRTKPPQGQGDGAIFLQSKKLFRLVVFRGFVGISSVEWDPETYGAAYRAAQQTVCDAWISALAGIENVSGTLAWAAHSLTVYKDAGPYFSGTEFGKKFVFGLYAPNPTIA